MQAFHAQSQGEDGDVKQVIFESRGVLVCVESMTGTSKIRYFQILLIKSQQKENLTSKYHFSS